MLASTAVTNLPAGLEPDLARWLSGLSDEDYQRTAAAHKALGRRPEGGVLTIEHVRFAVIVNRHERIQTARDEVQMESLHSRAYVFGVLPIPLIVRWRMSLRGRSLTGCLEVSFRRRRLDWLARRVGLAGMLDQHAREELEGFVSDMRRKSLNPFTGPRPAPEPRDPRATCHCEPIDSGSARTHTSAGLRSRLLLEGGHDPL